MVSEMTTNGLKKQLENWNQVNWKKVNKTVKNLRQRIFRARKRGFLQQGKKLAEVNAFIATPIYYCRFDVLPRPIRAR